MSQRASIHHQGFSLIELMIVIAIIGILATIAIPAYGDYITRAKVTDMLSSISSIKQSLTEFRAVKGSFGASDGDIIPFSLLGLKDPKDLSETISKTVVFAPNVSSAATIAICGNSNTLGISSNTGNDAYLNIYIVGNWINSGFSWSCQYTGSSKYVPASCRTLYTGTKQCND
jgi:type IV pilus assembly protein PilA